MEKEDLKGKRKLEDVYEIQVAANNQHEDAMMTMEWDNNYDYGNQEFLTEEELGYYLGESNDDQLLANNHQFQHEDAMPMMTMERANNYDCDNQEHLSDEDRELLNKLHQELVADEDQSINDNNNQELPADQDLQQSLGDCHNNDVPAIQYLRELPPGYVFSPSDQELLSFYLMQKIRYPDLKFEAMPFIPDVNIYEFHPEKLLERYQDKSGYFFTERTKRHANGKRPNRTVEGHGHWRMSTSEHVKSGSTEIGEKNGLVFHTGAPRDNKSLTKTNWLMKEYHIPGNELTLCRIYLNQ